MNHATHNDQFVLIAKYLSGEATPEEAIIFHQWLEVPGNRGEYDAIAATWQKLPASSCTKEVNTLEAWHELQSSLAAKKRPQRIIRRSYYFFAAACFFAVVVAISFLIVGQKQVQEKPEGVVVTKKASQQELITDTLPDRSIVTLNRNTVISYSPTFPSKRDLFLDGEAFFNVVHDKASPFIIIVGDLKVEVVGTSFNVKKRAGDHNVIVQVQSGIVKMYNAQKELFVEKGQTGTYSTRTGELRLAEGININSISYATRSFSFTDLSLSEVIGYLENAFNVKIHFDKGVFSECRITAEFFDKPLPYILNVITITLNSLYTQQGKTIFIKGKGCS